MATIINDDADRVVEKVRVESESSQMGWAVAVIILVLVIIAGAYAWMHYRHAAPVQPTSGATINVTVPGGTDSNAGNPPDTGMTQ